MVLAKIQWSNENGYEQKPATTTTTTAFTTATTTTTSITNIISTTATTTIEPSIQITQSTGIKTIRMMTTALATVENDLLAGASAATTTATTATITSPDIISNTELNETASTRLDLRNARTTISESDNPEKFVESTEICDKTDKVSEEEENLPLNVNNCEQFVNLNVNNSSNNNNNNNNNNNYNNSLVVVNSEENNALECDSNTNTLQNNVNYKTPATTVNEITTKLGISNNWCTDDALTTTEQNTVQSTESFLSGLGVDIGKNFNLPQATASSNKLNLNDDMHAISKTSTTLTLSNAAIGLNSKGSLSMPNSTNFDLSNNLVSNNAVVTENGQAKIILICESNSHPFQARTIMLTPNIECKVGRLIAKSKASETNAIFDCKVLSRNHAVLWYTPDDQKFWVKDTKSSNGTFINDQKLGNEAAELHFGDIVKFGVDVVENSRKEVHGCIIASVKLYLPDGREAISADALHNGRSPYSGEKCITYDELHRLNLYVQEVSNREKNLKSKLFNIQNLLDATRKNSGLCWQALIAEDQLLHRIHMLEKKLQVMDKNMPESALRNEVIKLLEDKNSYQQQAKETLKKVYQERCEALQLHAKMEAAYAQSENECKLLREQVMTGKQSLQEVSNRLLQLETEYIEYKEEMKRQHEDENLVLTRLLQDRDFEIHELKAKISALMLEAANKMQDDEERLNELQAVEKIDAAIADMDLGEDDIDDNNEGICNVIDELEKICYNNLETINGIDVVQLNNSKNERKLAENDEKMKDSPMMKWLQNSDLNKKEESMDIFKAICNESDSSDEADSELLPPIKKSKSLQSAYNSLLELEKNILHEVEKNEQKFIEHVKPSEDENKGFDGIKHITLLRQSVALLRDVYNDIIVAQEQAEKFNGQAQEPKVKLQNQLTLKEEQDHNTEEIMVSSEFDGVALQQQPVNAALDLSATNNYKAEIVLLQEKLKNYEEQLHANREIMEDHHFKCNDYEKKVFELINQVEILRAEKETLEQSMLSYDGTSQEESEEKTGYYEPETPISSTASTPTRSTVTGAPARAENFEQQFQDDDSDILMDTSAVEREEELIMYKENLEQSRLINLDLRREINELKTKHMPGALCTKTMLLHYILPYGVAAVAILYYLSTYL